MKMCFQKYNAYMIGYFAYQSCRIDSFVNEYPNLFCKENPLSKTTFYIVENREMGEWLKRYLADKFGSILGLRILKTDQALQRFSAWYMGPYSDTAAKTLLSGREIRLAIYKAVEELLEEGASSFDPIRSYLAKAPHGGKSEWLWQFAGLLADAFDFYDMNFPGQWEGLEAEWQHQLWKRIFHAELPYSSLGSKLSEIAASGRMSNREPARIVVLLPKLLGEPAIRFFQHMGKEHEIHHLLLMPAWKKNPAQIFVFNNSRPARHMALLCGQKTRPKSVPVKDEIGRGKTLLERLRESLGNDGSVQGGAICDDGSLGIHAVYGPRREIEVLKNLILAALRDDEKLAPAEIAVLAPDISVYASYIETVFPSQGDNSEKRGDHLEYEIMDLPTRALAPYSRAFQVLTSLPGSRFGRGALLSLFDNPCFEPTSGQSELASEWKKFVRELHVRWGSSEEHRREEDASDLKTGTWSSAFERLLAAYYHDEDDGLDLLPARYFGDTDTRAAGQLIDVIHSLDAQLRGLSKESLSLAEWVDRWRGIAKEWLVPQPNSEDTLHINRGLGELNTLSKKLDNFSDFSNQLIPWPVFFALLNELCFPGRIHQGRSSGRGIVCASIRSLRCIPFRRVYLLGMNEGAWPSGEIFPGFDLRNTMKNYEDLSREAEDRLCFLEVFFAARDSVSLIYSGRDSEFGNELSPAAPVVELMEHLGEGARSLVKEHPPAPYHFCSPSAGDSGGNGPSGVGEGDGGVGKSRKRRQIDSSLPQHLAMARSLYEKKMRPAPPREALPLEKPDIVDWQALVKFLRNPVDYFYRRRMGVSRPETPDDRDEYDVLEPDYLEWWKWRSNAVLESPDSLSSVSALIDGFRNQIRREGSVLNSLIGELQIERWLKESESLASGLKTLGRLELPFRCRFSLENSLRPHQFIRAIEAGSRIRPMPEEELCFPAPQVGGGEAIQVTGIIGGLRLLPEESDGSVWTMLDFVDAGKIGSKHNLHTWAAALMIGSALGTGGPRELRVFRLGRGAKRPRRYFFCEDSFEEEKDSILMMNPKKLLETLLEVFWAGQRAPIPLYPELVDEMAELDRKALKAAAKNGLESREGSLVSLAEKAWDKLINPGEHTPKRVRDCWCRKNFLGSPDFTSEIFARAWKELYLGGGLLPA